MSKIFCLMGKSASGKDTVYKHLITEKELGLKKIVPYTTRPIREKEVNGVQYYFTDEAGMKALMDEGRVIESRSYNTVHGIWYYFTVDDHQIDLSNDNYIIIGTPESFGKLCEYFGSKVVVPIYIELDDGDRLQRALNRERKQETPKYEEMCRRFLADARDFSEENLTGISKDNRFANDDLDKCVSNIKDFISRTVND